MNGDLKMINKVLKIVFYVLAAATVLLWFFSEDKSSDRLWMYCGFGAIGARVVTYLMKYLF